MTREGFIDVLDSKGYSYEIEGDKIVVTEEGGFWLPSLETLPPGVVFNNGRDVDFKSLKTLPPGVEFKNRGGVWLPSLETISPGVVFNNGGIVNLRTLQTLSPGVVFKNGGDVWLDSLETLPPGVEFKNGGGVNLSSLVGSYFDSWNGNIEGIDNKRLLNVMISKGVFI